jgi:hypothetical protein
VSEVPILVTGAVALGVPVIAALWARANQREQLRHDRQTRDLEELRKLLDEAAGLLGEARFAEVRVTTAAGWDRGFATSDEGKLTAKAIESQRERIETRADVSHRVSTMGDRIAMRLGRDVPAAVAWRATEAVLTSLSNVTDHDHENWKTAAAGLGPARIAFMDEANKLVASRLPPET